MKTIVDGKINIKKLLGRQSIKETEYRLMRYVLHAECEDGMLLQNIITGQLVLLRESEKALLAGLPLSGTRSMMPLIEDYFLVPVDFDEKETVDKLRHIIKRIFLPKGINNYLILPTTNCNARCAYCFENGIRKLNMSCTTADNVVNYITTHMDDGLIKLHWFGGEPLIGYARIDQICKSLKEKNVGFKSVMTTNGYLFTKELVNKAVSDWKLKSVQITLDGTESVYNRIKAFVSKAGSAYQRVIDNIELLLDAGINVKLRLNLDDSNAENLRELVDEVTKRFINYESNLGIYVSKINKEISGCAIIDEQCNDPRDSQVDELTKQIKQLGFYKMDIQPLSLKINSCMADSDGAVVILPDGRLSKCESIGNKDSFGHINSDEFVLSKLEHFREVKVYDRCQSCSLYPSCILLKACPTKKDSISICNKAIEHYTEELPNYYYKYKE